jgi:hypothetical protein
MPRPKAGNIGHNLQMPAHTSLPEPKKQPPACSIFCGPEGYLTVEELVARTQAGIDAYKQAQPLKYRSAMLGRHENGERMHRWDYASKIPKAKQ